MVAIAWNNSRALRLNLLSQRSLKRIPKGMSSRIIIALDASQQMGSHVGIDSPARLNSISLVAVQRFRCYWLDNPGGSLLASE